MAFFCLKHHLFVVPFALLSLSVAATACGSGAPPHKHPTPLSATEHEQQAVAHDKEAQISNERVEPTQDKDGTHCIDQNQEPLYSGGERTKVMMPCWTRAERNASYLQDAEAHRKAAREHREWAHHLVELEQTACSRLTPREREVSPLSRQPDILSVEEYRESGELLGAKITLRKVKGLDKEWLLASIGCHQARAAKLGYDKKFMPLSPLALAKTSSSVNESTKTITATLRSSDPIIAAQIYGRAARVLEQGQ